MTGRLLIVEATTPSLRPGTDRSRLDTPRPETPRPGTLRTLLTQAGYAVTVLPSGEAGDRLGERLRCHRPDAILLDLPPGRAGPCPAAGRTDTALQVPPPDVALDPADLCRRLRAGARASGSTSPETVEALFRPILCLLPTAPPGTLRQRLFLAGADDVLPAPLDTEGADELLDRLDHLLQTAAHGGELRRQAGHLAALGLCRDDEAGEAALEGLAAPGALSPATPPAAAAALLIEADPGLAEALAAELCQRHGTEVVLVRGLQEALGHLTLRPWDGVLIGPTPVDATPLACAAALREHGLGDHPPRVLLLDDPGPPGRWRSARALGLTDMIGHGPGTPKGGASPVEIGARLSLHCRRQRMLDTLHARLGAALRLAAIDPLTGLSNRRHAESRLQELAAAGGPGCLAVMILDLDDFKRINDEHGHPAGDSALVEVAKRLRANLRWQDLVARTGGEEFLVAMPAVGDAAVAARVAERVRNAVESPGIRLTPEVEARLTVSIGVAVQRPGEGPDALVTRADRALLASKRAGRNLVTLAAA